VSQRFAYSFRSKLTISEMLAALEALGVGAWHVRDKDAWGDYLFGRVTPDAAFIIIPDGKRYVVNVKLDAPASDPRTGSTVQLLRGIVLPAIRARWVWRTEFFE